MIPEFLKNFTKKFFPYLSITLYLLDFLNQRELLNILWIIYNHCGSAKGKRPETYTREEILEEWFTEQLDSLRLDDEVLACRSQALRIIHGDEISALRGCGPVDTSRRLPHRRHLTRTVLIGGGHCPLALRGT